MAIYGDLEHVRQLLRTHSGDDLGADVDDRLTRIQAAVSAAIDQRLGRTFGASGADTTIVAYAGRSSILLLPYPARSITSVTVGGTWDGTEYVDGTVYDVDTWAPWTISPDTGYIWGVQLLSGAAWGYVDAHNRPIVPVTIVGDFTPTDDDDVIPDDIQYAADRLIQLFFQLESSSATGFIGPEGVFETPRDPWKDPLVQSILDKYAVQTTAVVV